MLRSEYAQKILTGLSAPDTDESVSFLVRWMTHEDTTAEWNPLATTEPVPGATQFNDAGVKNYLTSVMGVAATLETINNGYYPVIVEALKSGKPESFDTSANLHTWSGGGYDNVWTVPATDVQVTGIDPAPVDPPTPPAPVAPVKPAPAPAPTPEVNVSAIPQIKNGSTGQPVRNAQGLLTAHGHVTTIDGIFGPATEANVKAFQQSARIVDDGIVGPVTWTALLS